MYSSMLRWVSEKGAAGYFRSLNSSCCGRKVGSRMMGTVNSSPSSTLPSRTSPWLMLPPSLEENNMVYNFQSLAQNQVLSFNKRLGQGKLEGETLMPDDDSELVGSSHGWLVWFNQRNCDMFLFNPLTGGHTKLPPIHGLPIPEVNLKRGKGCVTKVVISSSPDDDEEECRAMMSFGVADDLAFCCPGRSGTAWTPIGSRIHCYNGISCARAYQDLVYSSKHKRFFCITQWGILEGWDLGDPQSPRIDWLDEELLKPMFDYPKAELLKSCHRQQSLVFAEQGNQLFLVMRYIKSRLGGNYPYRTVGFDVYKIDRKSGKVSYMEGGSLDGLAMFIGLNHSFALPAAEFPELKPNSIYFTDCHTCTPPKWVDSIYGGHDVGIFYYQSRTVSACYYPCDVQSFKRIMPAPMWFTPSPH